MTEELRDVVVVGGGIAGLAAAWDLRNRDVLVLEGAGRVGGRIRSETRGDYNINLGAHVYSGPGSASGRLIADTGVEAVPVPGVLTAMAMNGKVLSTGRVETFPLRVPMATADRAAIARAGAKLRLAVARYNRLAAPRPGEPLAETRRRILDHLGDRTFAEFLGPLPPDADALFRPTVTRSCAEPEELAMGQGIAYFALVWSTGGGLSRNVIGGSNVLVDAVAAELVGRIRTGIEVTAVADEGPHVRVSYREGGVAGEVLARHVIVATKAFEAAALVAGLPADTRSALEAIPYGPSVIVGMLTNERGPMPYDGIYALATPKQPFNMLFNMANVQRPRDAVRRPGGSLMMYRAGKGALALLERSDDEIEREFAAALHAIYPETRGIIEETIVLRSPRCLPYPAPGRARLQPALERPLGRLQLAGDYLGTWYTESAIGTGQEAAARVRAALQRELATA
jgi:oxygen-dependent protoporphyrinogen oxidase